MIIIINLLIKGIEYSIVKRDFPRTCFSTILVYVVMGKGHYMHFLVVFVIMITGNFGTFNSH